MTIQSPLGEGISIPPRRPDRRWIRFFVKYYSYFVGIVTSLIVISALSLIDPVVMLVALIGYWFYLWLRVRNRTSQKWRTIYRSEWIQFVRALFLIAGVTLLLAYIYYRTLYLEKINVDTLWLLYLMAISIISQRGSRSLFVVILAIVIICLYLVSPVEGSKVLIKLPRAITLEFVAKSLWLISLSGLTYILLRYMSDAVADINLIVNVQNHIREMEGVFLRTSTKLNRDEYLEKSVEIIKGDLHYDHVNVYHLDSYKQELTCIAAACQAGKKLVQDRYTVKLQEHRSIIGYVVKTGMPYVTNNTEKDPYYLSTPEFSKTKSELVVPIKSRSRLYGVLDIQVQKKDYFLEQDLKAIEILANNIGWIVDNAEQFEHINWLNHMIEKIAMPIFTQNHLNDTLQEIADVAQQELAADLVMLYSYDPGSPAGVLGPIYSGQPRYPELLLQISQENDNVVHRLIDKGQPIYGFENLDGLNLDEHPLFRPSPTHFSTGRPTFISREQIKANVIIRLLNNGQCVGVLFLNFRRPRTFSYWDKRRYFSFAHLAALAIQKMQSQQREIQLEMTDLSKRIHDTLIGDTLGLYKVLNSIDPLGKSSRTNKLGKAIELAKDMTDHLHNDIRYISGLLEDWKINDLQVELDRLSIVFREIFKIDINIIWNVDPTYLTPILSRELLFIVREAITNAAKHARATVINISATVQADVLKIQISDNGIGFDPQNVRRYNGLSSMRYRMKELGGDFILDSKLGEGTTILLKISVIKNNQEEAGYGNKA